MRVGFKGSVVKHLVKLRTERKWVDPTRIRKEKERVLLFLQKELFAGYRICTEYDKGVLLPVQRGQTQCTNNIREVLH